MILISVFLNVFLALLEFFIELFNAAYDASCDAIAACKFKQAVAVFLFVFLSVLLLWGIHP